MLTVAVGFEASGYRMTRSPFGRRYSVTPSIEGPRVMPPGRAAFCAEANPAASSSVTARAQRRKRSGMEALGWLR